MAEPRALIRLLAAGALAGAAAACSAGSRPDPIVDRLSVDDARYKRDMEQCRGRSGGLFSFSNPAADCMKEKGYRVLMER